MAELKTEPGWKPARASRPWWAVALVTGVGAGAAIATALGLSAMPAARGEQAVRTTGMVQTLPPGSISLDERLRNIETTLNSVVTELAEVKARLPPKRP